MARIYRAEHEGLRRQVALKVLLEEVAPESDEHARFLREARIAAAIKHTNVVNIFDVGVHRGRPYLVMELLEGMDLEAYVAAEGALEPAALMDVIIPIAAALAAVHQAGIVHRDLKPGNIFLARGRNNEVEPKLLDFGISKSSAQDQLRLTSTADLPMGTPFYMSPEATRGLEVTALSDQYALGVVLYECATGVNPFARASTFGEVVRQARTGDYPRVSTLNPRLSGRMVSIIECAMNRDPARRYPSMRAMGRELLQLAGHRTRVTWGLGFNEELDVGQPARLSEKQDAGKLRSAGSRPFRMDTPLLSAVLLALGVGVGWMLWPRAELPSEAFAPSESKVFEVRPGAALGADAPLAAAPGPEAPLGDAPAASANEARRPRQVENASLAMAESNAGIARGELGEPAPRERKARRVRTARSRGAARRVSARPVPPRPVPPRPVGARAAAATEAKPLDSDADWAVSSARLSSQANRGPDRGTNNAPILE